MGYKEPSLVEPFVYETETLLYFMSGKFLSLKWNILN